MKDWEKVAALTFEVEVLKKKLKAKKSELERLLEKNCLHMLHYSGDGPSGLLFVCKKCSYYEWR